MKDFEFPFATDKTNGKPSVTLLFAYVAFLIAIGVTIYLTVKDVVAGSIASLMLFFGCLLMYRMRAIDKFKVNLQERSFEAEDTPDEEAK